MKSDTRNTTVIRLSVVASARTAGTSAVRPGCGASAQNRSRIAQESARAHRGGLNATTVSAKARKPALIWSDRAENSSDAVITASASFLEACELPSSIDRETSSAIITLSSRSACVCRTYGAFMRAVTFQSIVRTSSPGR